MPRFPSGAEGYAEVSGWRQRTVPPEGWMETQSYLHVLFGCDVVLSEWAAPADCPTRGVDVLFGCDVVLTLLS